VARASRDFNEGICEVVIRIRYVLREFNRLALGIRLALWSGSGSDAAGLKLTSNRGRRWLTASSVQQQAPLRAGKQTMYGQSACKVARLFWPPRGIAKTLD